MLLLGAIRIRSRISQFAIRLPHKKVTHKVGQKERKAPKKKKKTGRRTKNREAAIGDCFEIGSRCRLQRVAQS